jgi:single-strand DNA-binding protein
LLSSAAFWQHGVPGWQPPAEILVPTFSPAVGLAASAVCEVHDNRGALPSVVVDRRLARPAGSGVVNQHPQPHKGDNIMNTFHGVGRLAADPISRATKSGTMVCSMRIAFTRRDGDGADFLSVTSFGKAAETHLSYLVKGRLVEIAGHIQQRSWQTDDVWHERIEVITDQVTFLDKPAAAEVDEEPAAA